MAEENERKLKLGWTEERVVKAAEEYLKKVFTPPAYKSGLLSKFGFRIRDKMHDIITEAQEGKRHIIRTNGDYLVDYVPVMSLMKLAETMLTETMPTEEIEDEIKYEYDLVYDAYQDLKDQYEYLKNKLSLMKVTFHHFKPYFIIPGRDLFVSELYSLELNKLTNLVHTLSLKIFQQIEGGDVSCGCTLQTPDINEWVKAFCEGSWDVTLADENEAHIEGGFHRIIAELRPVGKECDVKVTHREGGSYPCTAGRLIGIVYGLKTAFKADCTTDEYGTTWARCNLRLKNKSEAKALGTYLSNWYGRDLYSSWKCSRMRRLALIIAHQAFTHAEKEGCIKQDDGYVIVPDSSEASKIRALEQAAMKKFDLRELPPLIPKTRHRR